jgi:hypothetical protein
LLLSGGVSRKRWLVALARRSGFHVTQISEPVSRTVGIVFCQAISDTCSASSTQRSRIRAVDFTLSIFRRKPTKLKSMRPSRVRMYFSPTS